MNGIAGTDDTHGTDDVVVVGGGPAGLAAAIALRRAGAERVVVYEREQELGGIPRHTDHTGFGIRDLRRVMSGPRYARRYVELAERAGVELAPGVLVTSIRAGAPIEVTRTTATGTTTRLARAVVLATGTRERPRAARLVPGDRPAGVLTTGSLQQLTRAGLPVGRRAVVVGAEHVSFSAVITLAHRGCSTVAMVTDLAHHQTWPPLAWMTTGRRRVPVHTGARVVEIVGVRRVEAVVLADGRRIACDTVVFTGDWFPDHELARLCGVVLDPATRGPLVDGGLRTATPGIFGAGNLLHGAETADVCALDGRHAARSVVAWLADGAWPVAPLPITCDPPLLWASPGAVTVDRPPRDRLLLRTSQAVGRVQVRQGARSLWEGRPGGAAEPLRSTWIPGRWVADVRPGDGPITVTATIDGARGRGGMADTLGLGPSSARSEGSTPSARTTGDAHRGDPDAG